MRVIDECEQDDRQRFDDTVIGAFGLSVSREYVYESLSQLIAIRMTATEVHKNIA